MVRFPEVGGHLLRDGSRRLGRPLGALLGGPRVSMRDWDDEVDDRRSWLLKLEFALVSALIALGVLLGIASLLWPAEASAHPGRLAADGCHADRKNGGRHCHGASTSQPPPVRSARGSAYYVNCSAARAAGAAPVRRGDPGYASHLDRDGDGVGCE